MEPRHTDSSYWALRVAYGVVPIVAGLDKFTNLLTDWTQYLSPLATKVIPLAPSTFMHVVGVIEIAVGAAILLGFARIFGFVASAWLAAIALNLLTTGHYFDVAARDATMAVGAFALGKLAQLHERATSASGVRVPARSQAHA